MFIVLLWLCGTLFLSMYILNHFITVNGLLLKIDLKSEKKETNLSENRLKFPELFRFVH